MEQTRTLPVTPYTIENRSGRSGSALALYMWSAEFISCNIYIYNSYKVIEEFIIHDDA